MGHYASELGLGPTRPPTDEEKAAVRRAAVRSVTRLKLLDAAEGLRELGHDVSADVVETIARAMDAAR